MEENKQEIDFQNIETIESVSKTAFNLLFSKYKTATILVIVGFFLLLFIPPLALFLPIGYWVFIYAKAHKMFMQQFAQANGLEYQKEIKLDEVKGRLFQVGHSKKISNVVSGKYKEHPIRLFNYNYTVGSGKHQQTYSFTVFEMFFEKTVFPYILLQSRTMRKYGKVDFWGDVKDEKVPLEDEFKKDYKLFATSGYGVEVFQIFTPEFLREMKSIGSHFSIEFSENRFYIYDDLMISKKSELQKLFNVAKKVFDSIGPLLNRLHDDFEVLHPYYKE